MAIDTEGKRRSTLGCWAALRVQPKPDGLIAIYDRQRMLIYSVLAEGVTAAFGATHVVDAGVPSRRSGS